MRGAISTNSSVFSLRAGSVFGLLAGLSGVLLVAFGAIGCAPPAALPTPPAAPAAARAQVSALASRQPSVTGARERCAVPVAPELREQPSRILPDERVPDFVLASQGCQIFDSAELVGKRPFVVVFFASWCEVCEAKLPLLRHALGERGDELTSLFVSLDDAAQWPGTEALLARNGLAPGSAVAGRDFLSFSLGYDPFRSVPVVVVVGRSGRVVDIQIGVRDGDEHRLEQALDTAIDEPPVASSEPPGEQPTGRRELTSFRRR